MMIKKNIDIAKEPTKEQISMLEALKNKEILLDDDCPEQTDEELIQFKRISEKYGKNEQKQIVTLRLSPQALKKAKMLGKGYTNILSQVLENALKSPESLEKSLHL